MFVRTVGGYDTAPQSASVRIIHALDGAIVGGVVWQNGRAGVQGSLADSFMRKGIVDAAEEIVESIATQMGWR